MSQTHRILLLSFVVLALGSACGTDAPASKDLRVEVRGPNDAPESETAGFPAPVDFDVDILRVTAFQETTVVGQEDASWPSRRASGLPTLRFGVENWISVEGGRFGDDGEFETLASGATPRFTFAEGDAPPTLTVLTGLPNQFQPAYRYLGEREESVPAFYELEGQERAGHTATELIDGSGMILAGGARIGTGAGIVDTGIESMVDTLEFYDYRTGEFLTVFREGCEVTAPLECALRMPRATAWHTATALDDGRVLFVGGLSVSDDGARLSPVSDAWLLTMVDRGTGSIETVLYDQAPGRDRAFHTATKMADGRVVIVGGIGRDYSAPNYQAAIDQFLPQDPPEIVGAGASLHEPRALHTATYFSANAHGIAIVGGRGNDAQMIGASEVIFASSTDFSQPLLVDRFIAAQRDQDLTTPRFGHSAVAYSCPGNGAEYLAVLGGYTVASPDGLLEGSAPTDLVEIYEPARFDVGTYAFAPEPETGAIRLRAPRAFGAAVTLELSGDVLYIGGLEADGTATNRADRLYNQFWDACREFEAVRSVEPAMGLARWAPTATMIGNGFVLVTGGADSGGSLERSEFYNPNDYSLVYAYY